MVKLQNKKAQIELQFNWIFVIIIGIIIMGFLLSFIFSQGNNNEKKVSASIARHFETIITSTNQKIGTVKQYSIPQVPIEFTCNQNQALYFYSIGDVKSKDTKYELIFSSKNLLGNKIYTWTEKWAIPYQVATFLYITNDREYFSFVESLNPTSNELDLIDNFAINNSLNIINKSSSGFENLPKPTLNKEKYVFILVKNNQLNLPNPKDFIKTPSKNSFIILIDPSKNNIFENGLIYFLNLEDYEKNYLSGVFPVEKASPYLGKASLYAGIFAGSKKRYVCGMSKALSRLKLITLMQHEKTKIVEPLISTSCKSYLIGSDFDEQLWGARLVLENMNKTLSSNILSIPLMNNLTKDIDQLERLNNKVVIESNCPAIY